MSEMVGRIRDVSRSMDGAWVLSFSVPRIDREALSGLFDKDIDVIVKQHRNRRSLDANAYCWVLIGKIAEKLSISKGDVYRNAIRNIGGVSDVVCVRDVAVDALRRGWEAHGIGWMTDTLPSKIKGCTNVILYYGSSTYDTKQMSLLIDQLIQDAKVLGIETLPPRELERMMRGWGP